MHFTKAIAAAILAYCATCAIAAPVPQLAGEGAAANSILSSTDNGIGYGIENAEDNVAGNIGTVKSAVPATPAVPAVRRQLAGEGAAANSILSSTDNGIGYGIENAEDNVAGNIGTVKSAVPAARRQLAGEGAAADSILTDTDNGVGYGTENAEDNLAGNIASVTGSSSGTGSGSAPPPPPPKKRGEKRQLDKISNGAQAVSNAAGTGSSTTAVTGALDSADGTLTSGAANAGAQVGSTEESTLEGAGAAVPKSKRQADKIAAGTQAVSDAAGTGAETENTTNGVKGVDGALTDGAAQTGQAVGTAEEKTLEDAGSSVPKGRRQLDKVSNGAQTVSNAAGTGSSTTAVTGALDSADGTLTSGAANAGAQVGGTEASTLEGVGAAVPKM